MTGEVLSHKRSPQWVDKGTYKEVKDTDNVRVPRLEVDDATTYVDKDGSDNLTLTDAVTGTKTLAQLATGAAGGVDTSGTPVTDDYARFTDADTIEGRDYTEVKTDLSLNLVENTAHSTDAHTMAIDGRDVSADGAKLDGVATDANLYVHPNHSGEVTSVADGATTIAADAVTYAKMQNVSATDKVLGRVTAGTGDVEEIACTAAGRDLLDDANAAAQKTTLSLNNVENTAHSTDAHTMTIDGRDVSVDGAKLDGISAGADVVGPASSVDNAIARFHETTGKIIQDYTSGAPTVSDGGIVTLAAMLDMGGQAIGDGTLELVTFTETASAVNNIHVDNAATGDYPSISVVGDDTNIALHLAPKGTGHINIDRVLPSTAAQELDGLMMVVDSSAQVATSVFHALEVETTGTPAGEVSALATVGKVKPLHQHVTTPTTPSQTEFAGLKSGGGNTWADGLDGIGIFVADDDAIFVGSATQFDEIEVIMDTGATKTVSPTFWYNTAADAWTPFFPSDGTEGFTISGNISWSVSEITATWTDDGDPGVDDTTAGYWIKIVRTRVASPGTPTPTTIKIGLTTEYEWDETGAITANTLKVFDAGGETITGDGTDMTIASGNLLNLTATTDVVIPVNVGLHFGDGAEKIESDNTDLTINSGGELNLTATSDVVIPVNIGLHLGDGAEKLESNNTDLTINSGGEILLTATSDVVLPVNIGLHLGDGTSKLESNDTDLTINAGGDINLTAVGDVNIPANVGVTFGNDGEKIEGNATDLTIAGNNINLTAVADVIVPANVGVTFGTGEKVEGDNTDLTVTSGGDIALTATGDVNIPAGVGVTFGDDGEKIEGDATDLTITSSNLLNLTAPGGVVLNSFMQLIENAGITLDAALSADEKYSGIVEAGTAGTTLNFGDCVYHDVTAGEWLLAKADATATSGAVKVGINVTVAQVADGNAMTVLLWGKVRSDADYAFTVDAPVFISAATAGDLTSTAPTGTTNFVVRIVGYGNTADELFFCPCNSYVELA